jgi:hypothetical protein
VTDWLKWWLGSRGQITRYSQVDHLKQQNRPAGYRKVGLTGTKALVESEVYPEKLAACGVSLLRPDLQEREGIDKIIFQQLVRGIFTPTSLQYLGDVVGKDEISRMRSFRCWLVPRCCRFRRSIPRGCSRELRC